MSCKNKCGCNTRPCGCGDSGLTTPCACTSGTLNCPELNGINKCAETFSDNCIYHEGDSIVEFGILKGDSLAIILQKMVIWINQESCINGIQPCQSVLNLQSLVITSTTIKIGWEIVGVPTTISVQISTDNLIWTTYPLLVPGTTWDLTGLTSSTPYYIRVKTEDNIINTCYSVTIIVTTLTT